MLASISIINPMATLNTVVTWGFRGKTVDSEITARGAGSEDQREDLCTDSPPLAMAFGSGGVHWLLVVGPYRVV